MNVPDRIVVAMDDDIPPGTPGTGGIFGTPVIGSADSNWFRFAENTIDNSWQSSSSNPVQMRINAVVPEPASLSILAVSGLLGLRRRR